LLTKQRKTLGGYFFLPHPVCEGVTSHTDEKFPPPDSHYPRTHLRCHSSAMSLESPK